MNENNIYVYKESLYKMNIIYFLYNNLINNCISKFIALGCQQMAHFICSRNFMLYSIFRSSYYNVFIYCVELARVSMLRRLLLMCEINFIIKLVLLYKKQFLSALFLKKQKFFLSLKSITKSGTYEVQ